MVHSPHAPVIKKNFFNVVIKNGLASDVELKSWDRISVMVAFMPVHYIIV